MLGIRNNLKNDREKIFDRIFNTESSKILLICNNFTAQSDEETELNKT